MEEEEEEREEEDTKEQCQQSGVGETDSVMVTRWEMGLLSIFLCNSHLQNNSQGDFMDNV